MRGWLLLTRGYTLHLCKVYHGNGIDRMSFTDEGTMD